MSRKGWYWQWRETVLSDWDSADIGTRENGGIGNAGDSYNWQ